TYTFICGTSPRAFAHQPITELPASISGLTWSNSLLRVLKRATENEPGARYQTVQDFWDDLNDVALPVTQPLTTAAGWPRVSSDLKTEEVLTVASPPRPRFETSRELRQQEISGNGNSRPRIDVPIAGQ